MTDDTPAERGTGFADFLDSPAMKAMGDALRARDAEFDAVVKSLAKDGIVGRFTTTACPVQFEGALPDGTHIYFRSRWDQARLDVWDAGVDWTATGTNPDGSEYASLNFDAICASYEADEDFVAAEASWLEHEEAEAVIRALVARHQQRT